MNSFLQNLSQSARGLRKSPGFTVVAVLSIALGMGANTAIFSVVDAVILRPLPYRDPSRLVLVKEQMPNVMPDPIPASAPDVVQFQQQTRMFESLAAFWGGPFELAGGTAPERINVDRVSANLFSLLGVQPVIGNTFTTDDDQPGRSVLILSYGLWQSRFGGSPDVLGHKVILNRQPYIVVGVMPKGFVFPLPGMSQGAPADIFIPMGFTHDELATVGDDYKFGMIGRLKQTASVESANAELGGIAHRVLETYPAELRSGLNLGAIALPLDSQVVGKVRTPLLLLLGAAAFVLFICCINVANLLLTRATDRRKEIAIRLALGVRRGRLLYQWILESMLLTVTSAILGLGFAFWITNITSALLPSNVPRSHTIELNLPVLAFTFGLAVLTGLIFGIVPGAAVGRHNVSNTLKESSRTGSQGPQHHRLRGALVIAEVSLAMILLVGAGLLLHSFARVLATDPGFQPDHILTAALSLPVSQYKEESQVRNFYRQLMLRLQQLPGVQQTGASTDLPLEANTNELFTPEGYQPKPGENINICNYSIIFGDYLQTMGVPLVTGRYFTEQDREGAMRVVIVSESIVRRYWPQQDPLGKRLKLGGADSKDPLLTVVGVVGDVKQGALDVKTTPHVYQPYLQNPNRAMKVAIRASGDPASLASALRAAVWALDSQLAIAQIRTMDQVISESTSARRFNLLLLGGFAALALVLAGIGIYGVIGYSVARRTHEIGIRMALGAHPGKIMRLIIGQMMRLIGLGVVIGSVGAFILTRFLMNVLYGVQRTDPLTFLGVIVIVTAVGLIACYVPSRRATRVNPIVVLRSE